MSDKCLPDNGLLSSISVSGDDLPEAPLFNLQSGVLIDESVILELKAVLADDFLLLVEAFFEDADRITDSFNKMLSTGEAVDYARLFQFAHSLNSVSKSMGAMRLSSIAGQFEKECRQRSVSKLSEKLKDITITYQNTKCELQRVVAGL